MQHEFDKGSINDSMIANWFVEFSCANESPVESSASGRAITYSDRRLEALAK